MGGAGLNRGGVGEVDEGVRSMYGYHQGLVTSRPRIKGSIWWLSLRSSGSEPSCLAPPGPPGEGSSGKVEYPVRWDRRLVIRCAGGYDEREADESGWQGCDGDDR